MKKYLVDMEGNYGYPDGDFHNHCVVKEQNLKSAVREYLIPYFENWIKEGETEESLITKTIEDNYFGFCNLGYGEELYITIKEV